MRSVVLTATLASTLWLAAPGRAVAQDPEPAPAPPPAPAREVAVPRAERMRMRDTETDSRGATESVRRADPAPRVTPASAASADQGEQRRGAVRRPPSSDGGSRGGSRGGAVDRSPDRSGGRTETADRSGDRSGGGDRGDTADGGWTRDRAVPRTSRGPDRVYVIPRTYYAPYYDPWGWGPGFAYYTPWGWGPWYYGGFGYGHGYGYGGGYGYGSYDYGSVKLKVKPRDAEVYVDNYFAGYVDDFDGVFQALKIEAGGHRIEVRKPGFETLQFDVHVQPERNVTFRGDMKPTP